MFRVLSSLAVATALLSTPVLAQTADPARPGAQPAQAAPSEQQQRPNVLVWMLDDVGFAQLSCFGGLVATPNIDRVARTGLRYSNYHTAPVCSAARASFLTGRMPHSVNLGNHAATARPIPGYNAHIPASAGTIAENLHQAGYATFALGKWDHLLMSEATPAGPFRQWPTHQGFDRFYGFLAADTDNWNPMLVRDQAPVPKPDEPGYHLNDDLADQAIAMLRSNRIADPARPFFLYWATGTAHAPHHAPKDWIERYKGKFDMGWDKLREEILKKQKAQGLVPQHARLAPRPEGMSAWNTLSAEQKKLYTRQMEVFAASLSYADAQFGRILDELEAEGVLENTIVVILSDNGASAEGAQNGMYTEGLLGTGRRATLAENMAFYDEWGGPGTFPHYSYGWAVAGNTPFRYFKHATHEGGTHVPLIVAWPKGIAAHGELRGQFTHVSDVAPTILEAAGVPLAQTVNNVKQSPMEGISFAYSFADADAPTAKQAQYFEMYGNKGLWSQGWSIVTSHRLEPWDMFTSRPINEPWELYNLKKDPGQIHDLASRYPKRVAELDRLFEEQAERYHVNPIGNIGDGIMETARKAKAEFARRRGVWHYPGTVSDIAGVVSPPIAAIGFSMRARLDLPSDTVTGPVFAQGGHLGGIALYLRDGKPVFALNTLDGKATEIAASEALPSGQSVIEMTLDRPRGPGEAKVTIGSGGRVLVQGKVPAETMKAFTVHGYFGVGIDRGSPVLAGAKSYVPFPGQISDVVFDFMPQASE